VGGPSRLHLQCVTRSTRQPLAGVSAIPPVFLQPHPPRGTRDRTQHLRTCWAFAPPGHFAAHARLWVTFQDYILPWDSAWFFGGDNAPAAAPALIHGRVHAAPFCFLAPFSNSAARGCPYHSMAAPALQRGPCVRQTYRHRYGDRISAGRSFPAFLARQSAQSSPTYAKEDAANDALLYPASHANAAVFGTATDMPACLPTPHPHSPWVDSIFMTP